MNPETNIILIFKLSKYTVESRFLYRGHDHPVTIPYRGYPVVSTSFK